MTSMSSTRMPPRAPSGLRRPWRRPRLTRGLYLGDGLDVPRHLAVPDARVEHRVEEIHDEVHQHDDGHDHQVDALDDGVIALVDRVEEEPPHARQLEDGLDDHGA